MHRTAHKPSSAASDAIRVPIVPHLLELLAAGVAGRQVADLLLERSGPVAALWTRRRLPLPPEPLRWLTVRALTGLFGALDRRVDRGLG